MNSFEELIENIRQGREIEFEYNDQRYSITNYCEDIWSLYNDSTSFEILKFRTSSDIELLELEKTLISGRSLKEIIDNSNGSAKVLYIL